MGIQETALKLVQTADGHLAAFYLSPDAWAKRDDANPIAHHPLAIAELLEHQMRAADAIVCRLDWIRQLGAREHERIA